MPVQRISTDWVPGGLRIYRSPTVFFEARASDFPGNLQAKLDALKVVAQDWLDSRTLLTDLHPDDPDRIANPGLPSRWWDALYLVERNVLITALVMEGQGQNAKIVPHLERVH